MELLAAISSAAGVWLTARRNMLGWPVSLLATGLYGWVFFHAHLYADTALQGVFCLATLYGWALWAREKRRHGPEQNGLPGGYPLFPQPAANDNQPAPITPAESLPARPLSPLRAVLETLFFLLLSALWIEALRRWSDDPTPLLDGGLSGASLLAQLWTARRHRVSWLLWSVIDVIYTGLFINRSLAVTALLYGGYTFLGLYGYWKWKR